MSDLDEAKRAASRLNVLVPGSATVVDVTDDVRVHIEHDGQAGDYGPSEAEWLSTYMVAAAVNADNKSRLKEKVKQLENLDGELARIQKLEGEVAQLFEAFGKWKDELERLQKLDRDVRAFLTSENDEQYADREAGLIASLGIPEEAVRNW